jgi:putative flippase GtrA
VRLDRGAVDQVDIVRRGNRERCQDALPEPPPGSAVEAVVDGGGRSIDRRAILPARARTQHLDDPAKYPAVVDKLVGQYIPARFVAFACVGGLGLFVHLVVLSILFTGLAISFVMSQSIATVVAMTFNFALNNSLTYRDRRLRGWQWLRGWISFSLACSVGMAANVGIASYVFQRQEMWVLAALAGVLVGAVWNFAVTRLYTWRLAF